MGQVEAVVEPYSACPVAIYYLRETNSRRCRVGRRNIFATPSNPPEDRWRDVHTGRARSSADRAETF